MCVITLCVDHATLYHYIYVYSHLYIWPWSYHPFDTHIYTYINIYIHAFIHQYIHFISFQSFILYLILLYTFANFDIRHWELCTISKPLANYYQVLDPCVTCVCWSVQTWMHTWMYWVVYLMYNENLNRAPHIVPFNSANWCQTFIYI